MEGVMSTPITRPSGVTFFAATKLSIPAPHPTSTTLSPGRSSPRLKGLPVPAKDSMEDSGMPSSHSSRYSSIRAKGLPVWKWKPFCGLEATSAYSSLIASRKLLISRADCSTTASLMGAPSESTLSRFNRDLRLHDLPLQPLRLDRVSRRPPLRKPLREPARPVTPGLEERHRLIGEHAVRPPAVGKDLLVLRKNLQGRFQRAHGHREGTGYMPGPILLLRSHVQDHNTLRSEAFHEPHGAHGLHCTPILEVGLNYPVHLC